MDAKTYIAALRHEREGYVAAGKSDRVAAVDAELERMGAKKRSAEIVDAPAKVTAPK